MNALGGGGQPGAPPIQYFDAARTLNELSQIVSPNTRRLIDLVVIDGYTIEQAGNLMVGPNILSKRQREYWGEHLRDSLRSLADFWGWEPLQKEPPIRGFTSPCLAEVPASVVRGHVVHATGHRVFKLG